MGSKGFNRSSCVLLTSSRVISTAACSLHSIELYEAHFFEPLSYRKVLYFDPTAQQTIPFAFGVTLIILFLFQLCCYVLIRSDALESN